MVRITRFALEHRAITYLMAVVLMVLGTVSATQLNQELVPPVEFPVATVIVVWPGASADEVTREVVEPLETAFEGLEDIRVAEVTSNASDSFAAVTVNAEIGTPQDELKAAVEDAVAEVDLPEDATDPEVLLFSFEDIPLLQASISGDMPLPALQRLVEDKLVPEIESIDGVNRVTVAGGSERKVFLELDPDAMTEQGITLDQIQGVLAANNLSFPAGSMDADERVMPVVVAHRIEDVKDLEDLVLRPAGMPAAAAGAGGLGAAAGGFGGAPGGFGGAPPGGAPGGAPGGFGGAPSGAAGGAPGAAVTGTVTAPGAAVTQTLATPLPLPDADEVTGTLRSMGFGGGTPPPGPVELPEDAAALGLETIDDLTADVFTEIEQRDPDTLRALVQSLVDDLSPAELASLTTDALGALPPELQSQIFAALAAPAAQSAPAAGTAGSAPAAGTAASATARPSGTGTPTGGAAARASASPAATTRTGAAGAAQAGATRPPPTPAAVTLGDVAKVQIAPDEVTVFNRTDGQASVALIVAKDRDANTVTVSDAVEARLAELGAESDMNGVEILTAFSQAPFVKESLEGVVREGILGALFAIAVIFVFLSSVRATLVVAVSIPLSVFAGLFLMNLQGLTLNMLTLGGITVAIGRVVDDAIVVLENVFRHIQKGASRKESIIKGTSEVSTAIASSTLVAVAVFLPLGLVGGITRQFFLPMALAITYALAASFVVAVTVVPTLAQDLMRRDKLPEPKESTLVKMYTPVLTWVLDHRIFTLILAAVLFLASLTLLSVIPVTFLPSFGDPALSVSIALPPGTPIERTDEVASDVEKVLADMTDVETVQTTVGLANPGGAFFGQFAGGDPATAFVQAAFVDEFEGDIKVWAEDARQRLSAIQSPGEVTVTVSTGAGGGPQSSAFDLVLSSDNEADLRVANVAALAALTDPDNWAAPKEATPDTSLRGRLKSLAPVENFDAVPFVNLNSNLSQARQVLAVDVDPEAALEHGLTTVQVAAALREVLEGRDFGEVQLDTDQGLETLTVEARYPDEWIADVDGLEDFEIKGPMGPVRLGDVAEVTERPGAVQITRTDGARSAMIRGEITSDNTIGVQRRAQQVVEDLDLPASVVVATGAEAAQQQDAFSDMLTALAVAVLISYLVMVLTFGSLVHPFTILLSLPFAVSGALAALAVTGRALSISSLIGLLMLIGIALANAIVLLDIVKQNREHGMETREAILSGGRTRLRPILMTALATVLGLVPLAIGLTEGAIIASELATVVIGGLITATLLTLIIVPVVYSLLDGLASRGSGGGDDDEAPASGGPSSEPVTPVPAQPAGVPAQPAGVPAQPAGPAPSAPPAAPAAPAAGAAPAAPATGTY